MKMTIWMTSMLLLGANLASADVLDVYCADSSFVPRSEIVVRSLHAAARAFRR